jgi:hypothetical protein
MVVDEDVLNRPGLLKVLGAVPAFKWHRTDFVAASVVPRHRASVSTTALGGWRPLRCSFPP